MMQYILLKNCPISIHLCFLLTVNHMEQSHFFGRFALGSTLENEGNTLQHYTRYKINGNATDMVNKTTYGIVAVLTPG